MDAGLIIGSAFPWGHRSMRLINTIVAMVSLCHFLGEAKTVQATPRAQPVGATVVIRNDPGGEIITYAIRVLKLKRDAGHVAIMGRCASACTLHLSLSRDKLCIGHNASFAFHLPYGASKDGNRVAASYLMRSYPQWVRHWIAARGGLSSHVITMRYSEAKQFIARCSVTEASN